MKLGRKQFQQSVVHFSKNVKPQLKEDISNELGISATDDLGRYPGMPATHGRVTQRTFQHVSDRIGKRLAGWKTKLLSLAARATFVQSAISAIPYFSMQTSKLPRFLCDEYDRKARKFLWGVGNSEQKNIHEISWENVTKLKEAGGLGLRSMRQANVAFMTKLGWHFLKEKDNLWSTVVRARYCNGRCAIEMFCSKREASNVWQGISENAKVIRQGARV